MNLIHTFFIKIKQKYYSIIVDFEIFICYNIVALLKGAIF